MAIHCHSARYHYDSFHNRGGDIINIGSNNTYNFGGCGFGSSIWGNGGNFWGGFGTSLGWGLGNGLMNWLGNGLNGGGWNPAGIFGGYGMGYGMNPWQQMSNFSWGGSTGGGADSSSSIAKKNTDYAKLNKLFDRKNALLAKDNPSLDDLKTLKNDIDAAAKNLDGNDDGNDNDYIKALRFGLDDKIKKLEGNQPNTTTTTAVTPTTTTTPVTTSNGSGGAGNTGNTNATQTPQTSESNMPWSSIKNEDWGDVNPLENAADNEIKLDTHKYSAITASDKIASVKLAHDSSAKQTKKDVEATENGSKVSSETKTESGKVSVPEYISLTTAQKHTYNYKCIGYSKQGYPVYTTPKQGTKNEGHIYILVKQGNDFVLLQCSEKFTGYRDPDKQNG